MPEQMLKREPHRVTDTSPAESSIVLLTLLDEGKMRSMDSVATVILDRVPYYTDYTVPKQARND